MFKVAQSDQWTITMRPKGENTRVQDTNSMSTSTKSDGRDGSSHPGGTMPTTARESVPSPWGKIKDPQTMQQCRALSTH